MSAMQGSKATMVNAGSFKKGEKRPKQGRPKGCPNKMGAALKDMILRALEEAGGVEYLREQAEKHPTAFMALLGKVLPLQVTGAHDGPITLHVVDYAIDTGVPRA
jgi:hypothetical protein